MSIGIEFPSDSVTSSIELLNLDKMIRSIMGISTFSVRSEAVCKPLDTVGDKQIIYQYYYNDEL